MLYNNVYPPYRCSQQSGLFILIDVEASLFIICREIPWYHYQVPYYLLLPSPSLLYQSFFASHRLILPYPSGSCSPITNSFPATLNHQPEIATILPKHKKERNEKGRVHVRARGEVMRCGVKDVVRWWRENAMLNAQLLQHKK